MFFCAVYNYVFLLFFLIHLFAIPQYGGIHFQPTPNKKALLS